MAFVWGIDPGADLQVAITMGRGECIAQIQIGYDDETDNTISVFTALSPLAGGNYEHIFCIVDADLSTTATNEYWDGVDTVNLFNKEDREKILGIICACTDALLSEGRPQYVAHYTHSPNLPAKALRKHQVIMGVFRDAGYSVHIDQPFQGRQSWVAELPT
jgi:hypothetical protein